MESIIDTAVIAEGDEEILSFVVRKLTGTEDKIYAFIPSLQYTYSKVYMKVG